MQRLQTNELLPLFKCVECSDGALETHDDILKCKHCNAFFGFCNKVPVMLAHDNALFPSSAYKTKDGGRVKQNPRHFLSYLKGLVPSKSINLARDRMFAKLAERYDNKRLKILVIGCGDQRAQLEKYFKTDKTAIVFCDIDKAANADVFCDGHDLPFMDSVFDGIITTAVLEHVIRPNEVVSEMQRVLSPNGFVYSEVPFMQGVHEGAYDFFRLSLTAHRAIYNRFSEIESGMVAGPGTALLWMLVDFFRAFSRHPRMSQILGIAVQTLFFWVKYIDYLIQKNPRAIYSASCTYFFGVMREDKISDQEIIDRFGSTEFRHT